MNTQQIIDSLDTRHHAAQPILRALANSQKVKPADIDALDSKFIQVAPLLHKINDGTGIAQDDIDALDSFAGERLRNVLAAFITGPTKGAKSTKRRKVSRKK